MLAMKFHQVIALDILDRFRISIFRPAVGMTLEQDLIKDHRSHIRCILGADGKPCQQLGTQFFHFRLWKGGSDQRFG